MSNDYPTGKRSSAVLLSDDGQFVTALRSSFDRKPVAGLSIVETNPTAEALNKHGGNAATVIADLSGVAQDGATLNLLQRFMTQHEKATVIAIVDEFSEATVRKLVQMRVSDILVKPVAPMELLRVCAATAGEKAFESQIHTFLPVAGGVGATTLAIQ